MTERMHSKPETDSLQPPSHSASTSPALGPGGSRPSNQHRGATSMRPADSQKQQQQQQQQPNATSDQATVALIRRILCAHNVLLGNGDKGRTTPRPIDEVLPPLTSSNEIDVQLYGIIAVIAKEFVQTWYSKITPDHAFVNEVVQIIAHCTRALEQRLRKVDLEALFLDEIPELLEAHLRSFRLAKHQATLPKSLITDPRLVYHTLHPHPALSPVPTDLVPSTLAEQRENESAWRQLLVQGALAVLLPTEDLKNACLRALVTEILAEMILGNGIAGKACEGWLLWECITRISEILQTKDIEEDQVQPKANDRDQPFTRLERFGLLGSSTDDTLGSAQALVANQRRHETTSVSVSGFCWLVIQYAFLACTAARAVILTLATASALPLRSTTCEESPGDGLDQWHVPQGDTAYTASSRHLLGSKRPIVSMKLWSCMAQLIELEVRMPWLSGFVSMFHRRALASPGRVGATDGVLDRLLSNIVRTRLLDPAFLPAILRTLRATIFPNNGLGPPRQIPSVEEAKAIKRCCASSLLQLLPPKLASIFFAAHARDRQLEQIEDILSCLDDTYLNKHLIFQIVEIIVLRLIPELGEREVRELLEERSGGL